MFVHLFLRKALETAHDICIYIQLTCPLITKPQSYREAGKCLYSGKYLSAKDSMFMEKEKIVIGGQLAAAATDVIAAPLDL